MYWNLFSKIFFKISQYWIRRWLSAVKPLSDSILMNICGITQYHLVPHRLARYHLCRNNNCSHYSSYPVSCLLHNDGLVQKRRNSIANALELYLSCTNLSLLYSSLDTSLDTLYLGLFSRHDGWGWAVITWWSQKTAPSRGTEPCNMDWNVDRTQMIFAFTNLTGISFHSHCNDNKVITTNFCITAVTWKLQFYIQQNVINMKCECKIICEMDFMFWNIRHSYALILLTNYYPY